MCWNIQTLLRLLQKLCSALASKIPDFEITGSESAFNSLFLLIEDVFTLDLSATGTALNTSCTLLERKGWLKLR